MPAGKLIDTDSDYSPEEETSSSSSEEQEKEEVPQIEPKDLHELIELLQDKGGISLENCQEVNMIRYCICETINKPEQEAMRNACLTLFNMTLNYGNMFLLHYNKGKDKMKMTIDQFKNQKNNYDIPNSNEDY